MLVILMHSALCIYFILLNWCHDTASACLYSNCIVISNVMVEYEYTYTNYVNYSYSTAAHCSES